MHRETDLTFDEFSLALAPSLGVPGKPSHELTVVAERVYDALVEAGVDVRAVVEGRPVLTQDEGALLVGAMPLQGFPVEPEPDNPKSYSAATKQAHGAVLQASMAADDAAHAHALRQLAKSVHCDLTGELRLPHGAPIESATSGTKPDLTELRLVEAELHSEARDGDETLDYHANRLTAALDRLEGK